MGSSTSKMKFEHGHLYLKLDKEYFVAGETVTGTVYIDLTQAYPAQSLDITIKGKEKTKWEI